MDRGWGVWGRGFWAPQCAWILPPSLAWVTQRARKPTPLRVSQNNAAWRPQTLGFASSWPPASAGAPLGDAEDPAEGRTGVTAPRRAGTARSGAGGTEQAGLGASLGLPRFLQPFLPLARSAGRVQGELVTRQRLRLGEGSAARARPAPEPLLGKRQGKVTRGWDGPVVPCPK